MIHHLFPFRPNTDSLTFTFPKQQSGTCLHISILNNIVEESMVGTLVHVYSVID